MNETDKRAELTAELEAAKLEQRRCMGGVDQLGCVAAAQKIAKLRNALRDDAVLFAHFAALATPARRARRC